MPGERVAGIPLPMARPDAAPPAEIISSRPDGSTEPLSPIRAVSNTPSRPLPNEPPGIRGGANFFSSGRAARAGVTGDVGKSMTRIMSSVGPVIVNAAAAPHFQAFLNALVAQGYVIDTIIGYNDRNKRGGTSKSEHAYGNAIDINAARNPFRSGQTDMPANISDLAASFGLSWGGDWSPGHKDTMHFEWAGPPSGGPADRTVSVSSAIHAAALAMGVSEGMLLAFAAIESSGNPNAVTGKYRGLFQLSQAEFQRYGGGDIYNASDNAMAAARKLRDEARAFQQANGRPPTAFDLYMVHQQGADGYAHHMANPDNLAWQNMLATREGAVRGEKWAKAAIWGNIPRQYRDQFGGSVDNVTSAQFLEMWQERFARSYHGGNSPVEPSNAEPTPQPTPPSDPMDPAFNPQPEPAPAPQPTLPPPRPPADVPPPNIYRPGGPRTSENTITPPPDFLTIDPTADHVFNGGQRIRQVLAWAARQTPGAYVFVPGQGYLQLPQAGQSVDLGHGYVLTMPARR